jgi:hypothetical protein
MTTTEIFTETARRVIESGATEKAKSFAEKVHDQVLAKGDDWIEKNKMALEITHLNFAEYADGSGEIAPIEDNRLFYLQKWQLALAA